MNKSTATCQVCKLALPDEDDIDDSAEGVGVLECTHAFHVRCIMGWAQAKSNHCPIDGRAFDKVLLRGGARDSNALASIRSLPVPGLVKQKATERLAPRPYTQKFQLRHFPYPQSEPPTAQQATSKSDKRALKEAWKSMESAQQLHAQETASVTRTPAAMSPKRPTTVSRKASTSRRK